MNSKKCLASLIDALGGSVRFRETIDQVDISGHVSSNGSELFREAVSEFCSKDLEGWSISIYDGEFADISLDSIDNEDVNLVVSKPKGGRLFFLSMAGFSSALNDKSLTFSSEVWVLGSFNGFITRGFTIHPWDGEPLPSLPCAEPNLDAVDPRKGIVRDLTGSIVPADPYRWMLVGEEGVGEAWNIWKEKAARSLATLFISEAWEEEKAEKVSLNGSRKHVFPLGGTCRDEKAYTVICQAAEWLLVKHDAEARHEVLVRRLSSVVRDSKSVVGLDWLTVLPESLQEALEGARVDHRAYVRSKSAETVKAMADLRKAVGEDVSRILERVHRLSNGFVVGLAALATGLGVRLTLLTSQNNTWTFAGIIFCTVVLAITWASLAIQRHVSSKSLLNELRNMRRWHRNIHTALTRSDYRELALHPVLDSVRLYRKTAKITIRGMIIASFIFVASFVFAPFFFYQEKTGEVNFENEAASSSPASYGSGLILDGPKIIDFPESDSMIEPPEPEPEPEPESSSNTISSSPTAH